MKGILLAGGSGTRLYPLTSVISKQLLPVYDKPMIYYPLSTLMSFGIRDILIISTPYDTPNIERLFGDGSKLGLNIQYIIQKNPDGIAQAFILGEKFIDNDDVCLILGDNIFHMSNMHTFYNGKKIEKQNNATIFAYHVNNPERFGVIEFDRNFNVLSIEEKPKKPKSNYVSVGLYFYPNDVVNKAKILKPSYRNELEITDLNNLYLEEKRLDVITMKHGDAWLDAGTPDSLMDSSQFVQIVEKRQGIKIACIEEIAYNKGFIGDKQMIFLIDSLKEGTSYREYLENIYKERYETHKN